MMKFCNAFYMKYKSYLFLTAVVKADWVYKNGSDVCIHMTGNFSVTINNNVGDEPSKKILM